MAPVSERGERPIVRRRRRVPLVERRRDRSFEPDAQTGQALVSRPHPVRIAGRMEVQRSGSMDALADEPLLEDVPAHDEREVRSRMVMKWHGQVWDVDRLLQEE